MPKRPRSGPPYTDIPAEVYVVVTNPWGMHNDPRSRSPGDFNRIASWAQFALHQAGLTGGLVPTIECIYGMGTRNEIILQFSEGTNILPLLGEHRWADFWKHCPDPNDPRSSCVFLYNWRNNGDPANHNWTENFPSNLPLDTVPAKSPYPAPSWTSPPSTLTNLVLQIPRPPIPPPVPNHEYNPSEEQQSVTSPAPPQQRDQTESGEQPVAQDLASTSLFRPYEPPSHHAQFLGGSQTQGGETSPSQASSPSSKFIKKLDPYQLDEDALNFIRSSNSEEEDKKEAKPEDIKSTHRLHVKTEIPEFKTEEHDAQHVIASSSGYQPSKALIDAFDSLSRHEQSPPSDPRGINAEVKTEEDDAHHAIASSSGYRPSQALINAFDSLCRPEPSSPSTQMTRDPRGLDAASQTVPPASLGYQPSAGLEADINTLLRGRVPSSPFGSDIRLTPGTRVAVKREYEDDVATPPGKRKIIKIEED